GARLVGAVAGSWAHSASRSSGRIRRKRPSEIRTSSKPCCASARLRTAIRWSRGSGEEPPRDDAHEPGHGMRWRQRLPGGCDLQRWLERLYVHADAPLLECVGLSVAARNVRLSVHRFGRESDETNVRMDDDLRARC